MHYQGTSERLQGNRTPIIVYGPVKKVLIDLDVHKIYLTDQWQISSFQDEEREDEKKNMDGQIPYENIPKDEKTTEDGQTP